MVEMPVWMNVEYVMVLALLMVMTVMVIVWMLVFVVQLQ